MLRFYFFTLPERGGGSPVADIGVVAWQEGYRSTPRLALGHASHRPEFADALAQIPR
jgi:hypothetical protein